MELLDPHLSNMFHRQKYLREITNFTIIINNSYAKPCKTELRHRLGSQGIKNQQLRFRAEIQEILQTHPLRLSIQSSRQHGALTCFGL